MGTYNDTCTSALQCDQTQNLTCNIITNLNPYSLDAGKCDCKRQVGDEWYWNVNATECEEAESYGEHCDDSFMCQILTEGTECDYSGSCSCPEFQYFNDRNKTCEEKLNRMQNCYQNNGIFSFLILFYFFLKKYLKACRDDFKLMCLNDTCTCDENRQFWDSSKGMCIDYLTYNTGECTNDSDCKGALVCKTNNDNSCECPEKVNISNCDCRREESDEWYWNVSECVPGT